MAFDPLEFASALAQKFTGAGPGGSAQSLARSMPALERLGSMSAEQLHGHLRLEHPQVMATLLALLPAELAAAVLEHFEPDMRDELVLRIALLDRVDPTALTELNDMLARTLEQESTQQAGGVGGARPVAEILSLFSGGQDQKVLQLVREHDAKLADKAVKEALNA